MCRSSEAFYFKRPIALVVQLILRIMPNERVVLMAQLAHVTSYDQVLRAQGVIRVLEIGVGSGKNLEYYPNNIRLTVLDSKASSIKSLKANISRYPNIHVDRVITGFGEDMSEVEDNSFDAVVASYVLCSVRDVNAVLNEIHRVLAPGGKFLFLEHGHGKRDPLQFKLQLMLNPLCKLLWGGCEIIKDTLTDIIGCGLFAKVIYRSFPGPTDEPFIVRYIMCLNFLGSAQKSKNG